MNHLEELTTPPPPGLRDGGASLWTEILDEYDLDPWQLRILEQAARVLDAIDRAEAVVEQDGLTVPSAHGQSLKPHPLLSDIRSNRTALARLIRELGLEIDRSGDIRIPRRG